MESARDDDALATQLDQGESTDTEPELERSNTITWYNEDVDLEWSEAPMKENCEWSETPTMEEMIAFQGDWTAQPPETMAVPAALAHFDTYEYESSLGSADEAEDGQIYDMIGNAQRQAEARAMQEEGSYRRRRRGRNNGRGALTQPMRMGIPEMTTGLEGDDDSRNAAAAAMQGHVAPLTFDPAGCRLVQLALEVCELTVAAELAYELRGRVREAVESPHGNYVIQKVVEALPPSYADFVCEELLGVAAKVSRHRYGCRIMCRLLEHSSSEASTALVINELLTEASDLCLHSFGHHVIECVLEHGQAEQKKTVISSLIANVRDFAPQRCAYLVIEKAMAHCDAEEHRQLREGLGPHYRGRPGAHFAGRPSGDARRWRNALAERGGESRGAEEAAAWPSLAPKITAGRRPASGRLLGAPRRSGRRPLEAAAAAGYNGAAPAAAW